MTSGLLKRKRRNVSVKNRNSLQNGKRKNAKDSKRSRRGSKLKDRPNNSSNSHSRDAKRRLSKPVAAGKNSRLLDSSRNSNANRLKDRLDNSSRKPKNKLNSSDN